jgi:type II secretory pathway pseudopilin PulG
MAIQTKSKGFSLVETALVVGIVGMVVGGTAIAMSAVRGSQLAEQSLQQIQGLLENYRNYYAARALPTCIVPDETDAPTYTSTLRQRAVFPESMCSGTCVTDSSATVRNAYGGTVTAETTSMTGNCELVLIKLTNIGKKGCARLLLELSDKYKQTGLQRTRVNSGSSRVYTADFPLGAQTANSDCSSETSNAMDLYFSIRR